MSAKKKTSTAEQLKKTIAKEFGGAAKDWKRSAKTKNTAGQVVREFKNKKTGLKITAVEQGKGEPDLRVSDLAFGLLKTEDGVVEALVYPAGSKESLEDSRVAADTVQKMFPEAEWMDNCGCVTFQFPKEFDTAEKIKALLENKGITFNREESDPEVLKALSAGQVVKGTIFETDPAKNAAADKAISLWRACHGGKELSDAQWTEADQCIAQAEKAFANHFCFAITQENGSIFADITPIWIFETEGCCDDGAWAPPGDLIELGDEISESRWEFDETVTTTEEAAKYLQERGFVWRKDFQSFIDGCGISAAAEQPPVPLRAPPTDLSEYEFAVCQEKGRGLLVWINLRNHYGANIPEAHAFVARSFPEATPPTDTTSRYKFPAEFDTASKLAQMLEKRGLLLDRGLTDPDLLREIDAHKNPAPKNKPPGPTV